MLCLKKTRFFVGICVGMVWVLANAYQYQSILTKNNLQSSDVINKPITAVFIIDNIPQGSDKKFKINAKIISIGELKLTSPIFAKLNWHLKSNDGVAERKITLLQGQTWQGQIKIKPAHGFANRKTFSYQRWLREKGLHATGYVYQTKRIQPQLINTAVTVRQKLFEQLSSYYKQEKFFGVISALTFGERFHIEKTDWHVLKVTNTSHLIAISGLHIGLVFMMSTMVFMISIKVLVRFLMILPMDLAVYHKHTLVNVHSLSLIFGLGVAIFYAYLANFTMPTIRAIVMLSVFVLSIVGGFYLTKTRLLLVSVTAILIIDPFAFISPSFWLSFSAVSAIFLLLWRTKYWRAEKSHQLATAFTFFNVQRRVRLSKYIDTLLCVLAIQFMLSIVLMPITALLYQQVSFVGFGANLVAVPWMSFVVIPSVLFHAMAIFVSGVMTSENVGLLSLFSTFNTYLLDALWEYLLWLSKFEYASIYLSEYSWFWLVFVIATILFSTILKNKRLIFVCATSILSCFLITTILNEKHTDYWQMTVFDVGHGLSILIEKQDRVILYDTGAGYKGGFNFIESAVLPYLIHKHIKEIDLVFLSHNDNDHNGGILPLVKALNVQGIIKSYTHSSSLSDSSSIAEDICISGKQLVWQGLTIEMLWPEQIKTKDLKISDNDSSCVLRISDGENTLLLPGDISKAVEAQLVDTYVIDSQNNKLRADIVIAPHHGSKTSSTSALINAISPQYVVFSTGYLNRWNMPNETVMQRYQQHHVAAFNTASDGGIVIHFNKGMNENNIVINTVRETYSPFWYVN